MNTITPTENYLAKVPGEILEKELFPKLGFRDLCHLKQVSKDLKNQVENNEYFKIFRSKYFPFGEINQPLKNEVFEKIKTRTPLVLTTNIENFNNENFCKKIDFLMFANTVLKQFKDSADYFTEDIDYPKKFIEEHKDDFQIIQYLTLKNCGLKTLPKEIGALKNLMLLNISRNQLKTLPKELFQLNTLGGIGTDLIDSPFNTELNKKLQDIAFTEGNYKLDKIENVGLYINISLKKKPKTNNPI